MTTTSDNIDLSFDPVARLVYKQVHQFIAKHGGRLDDLMSEAGQAYLMARDTYDPSKGKKFSTWVANHVQWALLNFVREENRHGGHETPLSSVVEGTPGRWQARNCFLDNLMDGLSADAKHLVGLAIDRDLALQKATKNDNKRRKLVKLLHDLGWAGRRIAECFREVTEALCPKGD